MTALKTSTLAVFVFLAAFFPHTSSAFDQTQRVLGDGDLAGMAANKYDSGELPLGDNHYVTDAPRKGYIYLCHPMQDGGGGAGRNGPWIHGSSWNLYNKTSVQGRIAWTNAQFLNTHANGMRFLSGNGLPVSHTTGVFPIQQSDPAFAYDRNPNAIAVQSLKDTLPLDPVYSDTPSCMGGEAGIMLTGVPLFNGFDAGMRDAAAHEVQDSCQGHPQVSGEYHYHSLSSCIKDIGEKTVIGYALDGFPITGPLVAPGRYLTTDNLDVCHGITSEITEDGQKKITYHYVMTQDFPYSVSCFRGRPTRIGPSSRPNNQGGQNVPQQMGQPRNNSQQNNGPHMPPAEALSACSGRTQGFSCGFTSPRGDTIAGVCRLPPGQPSLVCIPIH